MVLRNVAVSLALGLGCASEFSVLCGAFDVCQLATAAALPSCWENSRAIIYKVGTGTEAQADRPTCGQCY